MRIESFYRSNNCPVCPVCNGRHYPASNGTGRRVHCDGTPAETRAEQLQREQRAAVQTAREEQAEREHKNRTRAASAARGAETRKRNRAEAARKLEHERARIILQAERATRADAPTIDATDIGRLPDVW
jgi:hypothetical protein